MASFTIPIAGEEPRTYVVPLSHPQGPLCGKWRDILRQIAQRLLSAGHTLVNQHLSFDLRWIYGTTGVDLSDLFGWDTQHASFLLDENSSTSLKQVAPAVLGVDRWDDFDLSKPGASEKVPLFQLGIYAAQDTIYTKRLADWQRSVMFVSRDDDPMDRGEAEDARLGYLMTHLMTPTGAALLKMVQRGIRLDIPEVRSRLDSLGEEERAIFHKLVERYDMSDFDGEPSFAPTSLWFREWANRAVEHNDLQITAMTSKGSPQWTKGVLNRQARSGSEVASQLLAYRNASKQGEFLRGWLDDVSAQGTIHTTYWPARVTTGRLSSSNPNVQQISKDLKSAFIPRDEFYIAEIDFSQIELRVAAWMAQVETMLDAYRRGEDLHRVTASMIIGKRLEDITKHDRQIAKSAAFGLLYGMSVESFRDYADDNYGVILSLEEAQEIRDSFFEAYPGLLEWHARSIQRAREEGQAVNPLGRIRRLPEIWSQDRFEVGHAERQAINSPVQSFASDMMQLANSWISGTLPGYKPVLDVLPIGTVHDSLVVEVPADTWEDHTYRCMKRMVHVPLLVKHLFSVDFDVPLGVEATVGTRWGLDDVGTLEM